MTEHYIICKLIHWIDRNKYPYQCLRAFIYGWECDYCCMDKYGITREFEIKISSWDYFADAKKEKHKKEGDNYFYYVCPEGLIKKEEVDARYGLIYIKGDFINTEVVKKPRRLHENLFSDWQMLANKFHGKWWSLWLEKFKQQEITRDQYVEGYLIELEGEEFVSENGRIIEIKNSK